MNTPHKWVMTLDEVIANSSHAVNESSGGYRRLEDLDLKQAYRSGERTLIINHQTFTLIPKSHVS